MTDRYEEIRKTLARYEPDIVYIGTGEYVAECVRADDGDYYLAADVDAEIEALRAEVERLRTDLMESDEIREKLGHLLTRTAAALKGEPPAGVWHSWHDLPEKVRALKQAQQPAAAVPDMATIRGAVARGWCHEATKDREMDATLAECIAIEVRALLAAANKESTND